MGAGVAGAIKRAGGPEIEQEAMRQGPIAVGDAVATGAGKLAANGSSTPPSWATTCSTDAHLIAQATTGRARRRRPGLARSLALPAFGTGVGGFPIYACASIMVGQVRAYLVEKHGSGLRKVVFCAYDDVAAAAFKNALSGLTRFECTAREPGRCPRRRLCCT